MRVYYAFLAATLEIMLYERNVIHIKKLNIRINPSYIGYKTILLKRYIIESKLDKQFMFYKSH